MGKIIKKNKQLNIRMTQDQRASLKMFCANLDMNMTDFVQQAIEEKIVNESKKHEKRVVEILYVE